MELTPNEAYDRGIPYGGSWVDLDYVDGYWISMEKEASDDKG